MAAGTSPATPSRAGLPTCTQPPAAQEERCQLKSQEDSLGCREDNLFRVITYGNTFTFPPNYPNTVVPGKYSVQGYRLVIVKLGRSHCTVFICYSMPEFCFWFMWNSIAYCTSSLLRITCVGALGGFLMVKDWNPFWWNNVWECCQPVRETAHTFTHAEGIDFSALNEAN